MAVNRGRVGYRNPAARGGPRGGGLQVKANLQQITKLPQIVPMSVLIPRRELMPSLDDFYDAAISHPDTIPRPAELPNLFALAPDLERQARNEYFTELFCQKAKKAHPGL